MPCHNCVATPAPFTCRFRISRVSPGQLFRLWLWLWKLIEMESTRQAPRKTAVAVVFIFLHSISISTHPACLKITKILKPLSCLQCHRPYELFELRLECAYMELKVANERHSTHDAGDSH